MHHRSEGRILSQTQEEVILIGAFWAVLLRYVFSPLFTVQFASPGIARADDYHTPAMIVAKRAYFEQDIDIASASHATGIGAGFTGGRRHFPCNNDAAACIVEEWSWF